jgi:hypothetical protein
LTICRVKQLGGSEVEVEKMATPGGLLPASRLSFSGDGSLLLSCSLEGVVQVLDIPSMEIVAEFDQVRSGLLVRPPQFLLSCSILALTLLQNPLYPLLKPC